MQRFGVHKKTRLCSKRNGSLCALCWTRERCLAGPDRLPAIARPSDKLLQEIVDLLEERGNCLEWLQTREGNSVSRAASNHRREATVERTRRTSCRPIVKQSYSGRENWKSSWYWYQVVLIAHALLLASVASILVSLEDVTWSTYLKDDPNERQ